MVVSLACFGWGGAKLPFVLKNVLFLWKRSVGCVEERRRGNEIWRRKRSVPSIYCGGYQGERKRAREKLYYRA
tara:strand:+ start:527 stop:745 length:219 start_codon:yes stop_codon:yes gene_type:complete